MNGLASDHSKSKYEAIIGNLDIADDRNFTDVI